MNKIILAIDGLKPSTGAITQAIELTKVNNAHLAGIFLDDITYTSYKIYDLVKAKGGVIGSAKHRLDHKDSKTRAQAAEDFRIACEKAGINFTIHHDKGFALQDLVRESIFADLLVIDIKETLQHYPQRPPTDFIKDLLSKSHCPVLVVPHVYKPVQHVIFLYDGEPSAMYALKQFHYALPQMTAQQLELVFINPLGNGNHIPDDHLLKEWMKRHHDNVKYTVLSGEPELEILNYLQQQKEIPLVILGAYHRGHVSRFFKPSMADQLMKEIKLPLFIAH